jgi:hypothetical protein
MRYGGEIKKYYSNVVGEKKIYCVGMLVDKTLRLDGGKIDSNCGGKERRRRGGKRWGQFNIWLNNKK